LTSWKRPKAFTAEDAENVEKKDQSICFLGALGVLGGKWVF
jgi:hypothetical protein